MVILGVMLGVIWILMCVSCYFLGVARGRGEAAAVVDNIGDKELRSTVVNKRNVDEVSAGIEPSVKKGPQSYEVIMNAEWEFASDGMEALNAYVENSRDNYNTVRFRVVPEDDTDTVLYSSPDIPVGGKLTAIKLTQPLTSERSKAIVIYSLLDDRGRVTGEVKAGVTLVWNR